MRFLRFRKTINIQFAHHTRIFDETHIFISRLTRLVLSLWPLKRYDDEKYRFHRCCLFILCFVPVSWMHGSVKQKNQILIKIFCNRARHSTRNISCYDEHGQKFTNIILFVCYFIYFFEGEEQI